MNDSYLLEQLVRKTRKMRQCQKTYYSTPGSIKKDSKDYNLDKKVAYDYAKEAEHQVDILLGQIQKVHPVKEEA